MTEVIANVVDMERKMKALHPEFSRIFFTPLAFGDPDRMQSLASGYRGIGSATAIGAPQTDFIATTDVEEMAALLAASARAAAADSLLLRFFFRGVSQAAMEEQLGETGSRMLPHLRRQLAAL